MDKSQITQAMIDAYDEYTHLTLDRRRFMERLTALAGSGAAAAAIAPLLAANSASAEVISADDRRLTAKDVVYGGSSGDFVAKWLTRPPPQQKPMAPTLPFAPSSLARNCRLASALAAVTAGSSLPIMSRA